MNKESLLFFRMTQNFLVSYLPSQKGSSDHTVRAYKTSLNQFLDYSCEAKGIKLQDFHFGLIKRELLEEFLRYLENEKHYSVSTRNLRLASIKSFCKFAAQRDISVMVSYQEVSLVPVKKEPDHEIEIFSEEALKAILDAPDVTRKHGRRDQVFMIFLYDTAARLQEVLDLRLSDLTLDSRNVAGKSSVTIMGKGRKYRKVPLMTKTVEHLQNYIGRFHEFGNDAPLFYIMRKGQKEQLSQDAVEKFIHKYAILAKKNCPAVPDKPYPHMFRHTRATDLYRGGMPISLVSEWLGHEDIKTTMKYYASANTEMKAKAAEKATSSLNPAIQAKVPNDQEYDDDMIRRLYGLA